MPTSQDVECRHLPCLMSGVREYNIITMHKQVSYWFRKPVHLWASQEVLHPTKLVKQPLTPLRLVSRLWIQGEFPNEHTNSWLTGRHVGVLVLYVPPWNMVVWGLGAAHFLFWQLRRSVGLLSRRLQSMLASAETGAGKCLWMSVSRTPLCSITCKCQGYTCVHASRLDTCVYETLHNMCITHSSFSNYDVHGVSMVQLW